MARRPTPGSASSWRGSTRGVWACLRPGGGGPEHGRGVLFRNLFNEFSTVDAGVVWDRVVFRFARGIRPGDPRAARRFGLDVDGPDGLGVDTSSTGRCPAQSPAQIVLGADWRRFALDVVELEVVLDDEGAPLVLRPRRRRSRPASRRFAGITN